MKKYCLLWALQLLVFQLPAQLSVTNLKCEDLVNPIGIGAKQPRFSWQLVSDKRNTLQSDYEIKILLNKTEVWNSGKVSRTNLPIYFIMEVPHYPVASIPGK
jgi:alpha-L-rhamnosidase